MTNEILEELNIKIQYIVAHKELQNAAMDLGEINLICDNIKKYGTGQGLEKEELDELKAIYKGLHTIFTNISIYWDNNKNSPSNGEIKIHDQNLGSILKIVALIKELDEKLSDKIISADETISLDDIKSLQKEMKEALKKMQQQNAARQKELEKKSEEEFSKYIKNGTIDGVSIKKHGNCNLFYAIINLKDDNENTGIEISEFLNSKFCTENNIAGFSIKSSQEEVIKGYIDDKKVRYYDLGTTAQYGIKFNWYVGEKECSITLSANSDGSIKIVSDKPADEDLEKNKDVRIKVGDCHLSLADAVKTCKQNNQQKHEDSSKVSSKLDQSLVSQGTENITRDR